MKAVGSRSAPVAAGTALRGRDIICFSHDWSGDPLSKTHIMRILARDNRILWVNALANRVPQVSKSDFTRVVAKLSAFAEPIKQVERNIFVMNPLALPSYRSRVVRALNQRLLIGQVRRAMRKIGFDRPVNIIFNPAAGLVAGLLGEDRLIYYCVDEYTAFTGASKGLGEIERKLFSTADLVIVSAERLLETKKSLNRNTHLIRHGTDWGHFRQALDPETAVPDEIAHFPRPVIGFHGLLADWIDYELIRKIAERFSKGSVVLIGKVAADAERLVDELRDVPNIHLKGRRRYAELPAFCKAFDVAINPFIVNKLTEAANPLKVREYLAAGLVPVSTDLPEVRVLEHCLVATSHDDFLSKLEQAISTPRSREEISDSVRDDSWESRVDILRKLVAEIDAEGTSVDLGG